MGKNKIIPKPQDFSPEELALLAEQEKIKAEEEAVERAARQAEDQLKQLKKIETKKRKARVKGMLDGSILLKEGLIDHWRFILFCFILAVLLIASNYFAESTAREISKMKKEMKELRTIEVSTKADLMSISIQSSVAAALDTFGIKESVVPPMKIVISKTDKENDAR